MAKTQVKPYCKIVRKGMELAESNAVALLKLRTPVTGRCTGVACLPTAQETAKACASYDNCVIAGWGFTTDIISEDQRVETLMLGQNRLSSRVACDFLSRRLGLQASRPAGSTCQGPQNKVTDGCLVSVMATGEK
ncbi:hypothetical protein ElyMa_000809900 [Elysia marginata]|uniref:Peptidase S1 domain-containing protein n=1 Tax=Elysia marginata TaxID=1093978 RepID=A0AAV4H038_9GAST|nr:hypothetical protein ElyMa_000809900 [Elysia marginata]